jgi:hypothetical protein
MFDIINVVLPESLLADLSALGGYFSLTKRGTYSKAFPTNHTPKHINPINPKTPGK